MGSHFEPSPPDQKAMNFSKRDLKLEVDAKDSDQKAVLPSFREASNKTTVDPKQPFCSRSVTFLMDDGVKLT